MIIKPFTKKITGRMTPTDFGNMNESDVAFHLKRAFKDSKDVFILNNVQIKYDSENAYLSSNRPHKMTPNERYTSQYRGWCTPPILKTLWPAVAKNGF